MPHVANNVYTIAPVMLGNAPYSSPQTLLGVECLLFKQLLKHNA